MIIKENRLKKRKQFNYLFKNGKHISSDYLSLVYQSVKTKNFKIGYSLSKKIGCAVIRNKTKRRLKEIVLKFSEQIKNEFFIVLVPKTKITELSFLEMYNETYSLFKKANLLNDKVC